MARSFCSREEDSPDLQHLLKLSWKALCLTLRLHLL